MKTFIRKIVRVVGSCMDYIGTSPLRPDGKFIIYSKGGGGSKIYKIFYVAIYKITFIFPDRAIVFNYV